MKYSRLTKEQMESLHEEFAKFLATQSIDKKQWEALKSSNSVLVEEELDLFSDMIWEQVLDQTNYLEHFSPNYIFLFQSKQDKMHSIVIKSLRSEMDLMTSKGLEWLVKNLQSDQLEILIGQKAYDKERNEVLFEIIQQGAILSNGELYKQIEQILE